ncbi:MAG: hypothetical protein M1524_03355 [Patescibacteria group bacterium]|nr:hypothetical protein [Patescibacteria group bacterium]
MEPKLENPTENAAKQTQSPNLPRKNNLIIVLLVFIIVLLVGGGAYYLGVNKNQANKDLSAKPTSPITQTVSPSITKTPIASPTAEPTISPNSNLFSSDKLGVSFLYAKLQEAGNNSTKVNVQETGNKVYVYINGTEPESGQSVEVFQKNPADSLEQAISKQFLSGISKSDCFVKISTDKNLPSNFTKATIGYPVPTNSTEPYFIFGEKCPQNYKESNGISYFLEDLNHPDKFLYFSIGQYGISSETGNNNAMWQDSIRILN